MKVRVKEEKLGSLIKKLDVQVSLFVRLTAADQNGTVRCISCPDRGFWSDFDCAHLKDRDNMATRWYLPNLAPACPQCNRFDHYNHIGIWERRLTEKELYILNMRSHSLMKFTRFELEEKIIEFTEKVKTLRREKGL